MLFEAIAKPRRVGALADAGRNGRCDVGAPAPDATFSADALKATVTPVRDGIELTVTPPPGAPAYFLTPTVR